MENTEEFLIPEYSAKPKFAHTLATEKEWLGISQWAKFFAIFGFVILSLNLVYLLFLMAVVIPAILNNPMILSMIPTSIIAMVVLMFSIMVVGLILQFRSCIYHLRFTQKLRIALRDQDQAVFQEAWQHFKNAWKSFGIYIIMMLSIGLIYMFALGYLVQQSPY